MSSLKICWLRRLLEGIKLIRSDEGRHLVHGMDFLREQLIKYPEHVAPVRELFMTQAANIPRRTDFIFTPNPLGLDRDRIQQISYANHSQRMREAGVGIAFCEIPIPAKRERNPYSQKA